MRTSLIVFGVIFLVIGGFFYFVPVLNLRADTSTAGGGVAPDTRTSSASITIPVGLAYASAIVGFLLLAIGLIAPGRSKVVQGPKGARGPRGYVNHKKKKTYVHHRRPVRKKSRRRYFPKGTSVTTTTRTRRSR